MSHVIQTIASLAERGGGPSRTVPSLSEALARAGVAVSVVTGTSAADDALMLPDPRFATTRTVAVRRRFGIPRYDFDAAVGAALGDHPAPALVHDNGIWAPANIAATAAARRHGLKYVVSLHGMLEPWAMAWHRHRKRLAWVAYQRSALDGSAALLANAAPELAAIRALFPRQPIALIANGVDVPVMLPAPRPDEGPRTLLYLSRVHPKKNIPGLLDAWAMLCADAAFGDWMLTIAGPDEGGHTAELRAQAARLGIAARVAFPGPVADRDKGEVFAAADLFVLPSFCENFGIVVAEALAYAVPVVTTRGTPWSELAERRCGWWVAAETGELAGALGAAMRLDPASRRAMGERGRDWVSRSFGWDNIGRQTAAFYEWILHGGAKPEFVDV